jgi:hypothetical protein
MTTRLSPQEIGVRAQTIYRDWIQNRIAPSDRSKVLVIDIDTRDFEIDADEEKASERIEARRPNGQFYVMRADGGPVAFLGTWQ